MKHSHLVLQLFLLLSCVFSANAGQKERVTELYNKVVDSNKYHMNTADGLTELLIDIVTAQTFNKMKSGLSALFNRTSPGKSVSEIKEIRDSLRTTLNQLIISNSIKFMTKPDAQKQFANSFSNENNVGEGGGIK